MNKFEIWYGEQIVDTIKAENKDEARQKMQELKIVAA